MNIFNLFQKKTSKNGPDDTSILFNTSGGESVQEHNDTDSTIESVDAVSSDTASDGGSSDGGSGGGE